MKTLATVTLLLALAVGCLGYVDYVEAQAISVLTLQMSALNEEVVSQHQALLTHKKAIIGLRAGQKQEDKALVAILLYLKSEDSPKSEPNSYDRSRLKVR